MNDEQVPDEVELALRARLKILQQEHADLEASIEALGHMPIPDQLMMRLFLKSIVTLEMKEWIIRITQNLP